MIYVLLIGLSFIITIVTKVGGNPDYFSSKWFMLLVLGSLFISHSVWKKYHWSAGCCVGYFLINALNVTINYSNQYSNYNPVNKITLIAYSGLAIISYLILYFLVDSIKKNDYFKLDKFLAFVCVTDSIYVIVQALNGNYWSNRGGFWSNVSVNGVFIALLIPFLFSGYLKYFSVLAIVACLCTKSSVSVGALAVVLSTLCFMQIKRQKFLVSCLIIASVLLVARNYDPDLLNDSHRFRQYSAYVTHWIAPSYFTDKNNVRTIFPKKETNTQAITRYATGWGVGTFPFHGILAQKIYKLDYIGWAQWAHSDWLQILLDAGIIGFLLSVNLFFWCLWYSRKDKILFAQITCFGAAMVFLYPVRYPVHAFLMFYFIKKSLQNSVSVPNLAYNERLLQNPHKLSCR